MAAARREVVPVAAVVLALVALSYRLRFFQDDGFITLRYAENLASGLGAVYNAGERVEGYSNLLYVLLEAAAFRLGVDPIRATYALGLSCQAAVLALVAHWARKVGMSVRAVIVLLLTLGTQYTFAAYATGGLETPLQTLLTTWLVYVVFTLTQGDESRGKRLWAFGAVAAAALLNRLDAGLVIAVGWLGLGWHGRFVARRSWAQVAQDLAAAAALPVVTLAIWTAWRWSYYHAWIPNSVVVKTRARLPWTVGVKYLVEFVARYGLVPALALMAFRARAIARSAWPWEKIVMALAGAWCVLILRVGGDFMEYRFMVALLPVAYLAAAAVMTRVRMPGIAVAAAVASCVWSSAHAALYGSVTDWPAPISVLDGAMGPYGWADAGRELGRVFAQDRDVVIATTAAGALPFYAKLPTIDQLGLNDAFVAREGIVLGHGRPGHQIVAPLDYLRRRGVNLLIGHPLSPAPGTPAPRTVEELLCARWRWLEPTGDCVQYDGMQVVRIPYGHGRALFAVYLTPHPAVDRAIREQGWALHRLNLREEPRAAGESGLKTSVVSRPDGRG